MGGPNSQESKHEKHSSGVVKVIPAGIGYYCALSTPGSVYQVFWVAVAETLGVVGEAAGGERAVCVPQHRREPASLLHCRQLGSHCIEGERERKVGLHG